MSPELDYHYLPDSRSKLLSRSCNAALETNQCWVDKVLNQFWVSGNGCSTVY